MAESLLPVPRQRACLADVGSDEDFWWSILHHRDVIFICLHLHTLLFSSHLGYVADSTPTSSCESASRSPPADPPCLLRCVVLLPNSIAILRINTAPKRNTICYFQNHTFNRILWLWKTSTTQLVPERSDRTSPTRRPPSHRIRDCSNRSDAAITTYTYTYT